MYAVPMPDAEQWLNNVDLNTVAELRFDDGEHLTAEILDLNDERDELTVEVIAPNPSHANSSPRRRIIPLSRVVSCEPRARTEQVWPYSDPCRVRFFSTGRFVLLGTPFLSWTIGSLPLYLFLINRPYGVQEESVIAYSIFVVFFTFAATGSIAGKTLRPYMFTCPAVRTQASRLIWRHLGFLVLLFAFQTLALAVRPSMPD